MKKYITQSKTTADELLAYIENTEQLRRRLTLLGVEQTMVWMREHSDELCDMISSPSARCRLLESPRSDMLCYCSAMLCRMAGALIELLQDELAPVSGDVPAVVCRYGLIALKHSRGRYAPWPFDGGHPFALRV